MPLNPEVTKLVTRMRETADKISKPSETDLGIGGYALASGAKVDLNQGANTIEDLAQEAILAERARGNRLGKALTATLTEWFEGEFGVKAEVDIQPDSFPGQMRIFLRSQWVERGVEGMLAAPLTRDVRIDVGVRTRA